MTDEKPKRTQWCLIGNIIKDKPGAKQRSVKNFAPGAKVYCLPATWGDGYDQFNVIGHHQEANRFVAMVSSGDRIENWRAKAVYSAEVIHLLDKTARDSGRRNWTSRKDVETYIAAIKKHLAGRSNLNMPASH
jgi:hypothetical protein